MLLENNSWLNIEKNGQSFVFFSVKKKSVGINYKNNENELLSQKVCSNLKILKLQSVF